MITAIKNGHKKNFSDYAWKLLGKNKNGWEQVSDSVAKNIVNKTDMPDSGQKSAPTKQVVENTVIEEEKDSTVNTSNALEEATVDGKDLFVKAVKESGITKAQIKDFLDSKEVSYKVNDSLETLSSILFKQLATIENLNTQFGL